MATINLGSIKFKWKGTYAGGTAYTVDDVVSYNGSSYICILASTGNLPTNATYFEQMSQAGTNGTDLTTTLTTQGDLVYRDGSGLQRLGAGTAGQVLQTGGAGANPSWSTVSSDWVRLGTATASSSSSINFDGLFTSDYDVYKIFFHNITHSNTSADLYIRFMVGGSAITTSTYNFHVNQEGYSDGGISSGGVTGAYPSTNSTEIRMNGDGILTTSNYHAVGSVDIFNPLNATAYKAVKGYVHYMTASKILHSNFFGRNTTTSALSGVQFLPQTGNFTTGKFHLYGMKNN